MADEYLTPEQAASLLQVSVFTIRRWIKDGTLRATKLGRLWRIQRSDVEALFASGPRAPRRRPTRGK